MHSRSKSSVATPSSQALGGGSRRDILANAMKTPERRPITSDGRSAHLTPPHQLLGSPGMSIAGGEEDDHEDDEETKKKKDQAMMSRLRRVKSLFNTKAGSKLKRLGGSRPGTAHSTASKAGE